jgi:hypothetical protein
LAFIREKENARVKEKERERNITAPVCRLRKMSVLYLAGYATHSILFYFFVFRGDWGDVQISVLLFFFLFPSQHTSFTLDTPIDFQNNPLVVGKCACHSFRVYDNCRL